MNFLNMNFSNGTLCEEYKADLSLQNYLLPIFYSVIFLMGLMGNITVIYIIFFKPGMTTVPNLLIANLSLGDIVFIFGHMCFSIPSYLLPGFYGGNFLCRLMVFVKCSCLGISIFTLTFMAVDRFRAITRPLHQQALSRVAVITVMVTIWIFSMAASVPTIMYTEIKVHPISNNDTCFILRFCSSEHPYFEVITWVRFCVYFVIPFFVISFCYIAISTTLCKTQNVSLLVVTNHMDNKTLAIPRRQMEARRKLSVVVLALVVIFVVCRLPYESHSIFLLLQSESIQWWSAAATVLLYFYSSINPLILGILSPTFRRFMLKMWCRCFFNFSNTVQTHSAPPNSTKIVYNRTNRSPSPCELLM
uniref:GCR074 n=1 Tax=Schmidtea mediterranea TaxID=79327 RepID=A0A193KUA5_SCHMD|nr:GCR074 [Schmidtea mediterranea]